MLVGKTYLENKVHDLNNWLSFNNEANPEYRTKVQERNYYVWKLFEMDNYSQEKIEI